MAAEQDLVRLRHMLDAARRAVAFASGTTREGLAVEDSPVRDALVHLLTVVGEAASRVSPECRSELPDVRWSDIGGMRNRLVHGYFDVNLDIVWATVADDLPILIESLAAALSRE